MDCENCRHLTVIGLHDTAHHYEINTCQLAGWYSVWAKLSRFATRFLRLVPSKTVLIPADHLMVNALAGAKPAMKLLREEEEEEEIKRKRKERNNKKQNKTRRSTEQRERVGGGERGGGGREGGGEREGGRERERERERLGRGSGR